MPAITKDTALVILRTLAEDVAEGHSIFSSRARTAIAATEHITDTAATQAAEKPQDGLVLPPMRGTDSQRDAMSAAILDAMWNGVSAVRIEHIHSSNFRPAPQPVPRAGRNAQPDSNTDLASTDLSAVEVPPLPEPAHNQGSGLPGAKQQRHFTADQMTNFYREGYAAGRASLKGNK